MWRLDHHDIDDGDVEVYPSEYPFESNYESVTDLDTTPTKSNYDDEMDHLPPIVIISSMSLKK